MCFVLFRDHIVCVLLRFCFFLFCFFLFLFLLFFVSSFFCFFGDVAFSEYFCTITIFSLYGEYVVLNSTFFPSGWCFPTLRPLGLYPFCFCFCFHAYLRIAGVAQAIMLWHMLLFGDAFGPAYAIFLCFCIQLCSFLGGSNFKKCFQQVITLLYGRFRRSQQYYVQRMCVQLYVCVYAKYPLCVHTAVRPRNIPRNINRMMTGCCWGVINQ